MCLHLGCLSCQFDWMSVWVCTVMPMGWWQHKCSLWSGAIICGRAWGVQGKGSGSVFSGVDCFSEFRVMFLHFFLSLVSVL